MSAGRRTVERDPVATAFIYGLGAAVGLAWFASIVADIAIADYGTPAALHGIMGIVVGAVFGDLGLRARYKALRENQAADDGSDPEVK